MAFPAEHWTRIYSTNPLELLNKEIKRRINVMGIFPDIASVRLGAILIDLHDQWQVNRRYFGRVDGQATHTEGEVGDCRSAILGANPLNTERREVCCKAAPLSHHLTRHIHRSTVAVAHSIIVIAYHQQKWHQPHQDLGGDYYDRRKKAHLTRHLTQRLQQLGYFVDVKLLHDLAAAA